MPLHAFRIWIKDQTGRSDYLYCALSTFQVLLADQWRPFEKTVGTNVLKNDSTVVVAEEVISERINIESTNKFKIMEWRVQKLK